jgi:hypothetical protein
MSMMEVVLTVTRIKSTVMATCLNYQYTSKHLNTEINVWHMDVIPAFCTSWHCVRGYVASRIVLQIFASLAITIM